MTICYLCERKAKMTREHIWSSALVALFDDAPLTLDEKRRKIYLALRSLLGVDVFPSGFPFNEYTCVFYNIVS